MDKPFIAAYNAPNIVSRLQEVVVSSQSTIWVLPKQFKVDTKWDLRQLETISDIPLFQENKTIWVCQAPAISLRHYTDALHNDPVLFLEVSCFDGRRFDEALFRIVTNIKRVDAYYGDTDEAGGTLNFFDRALNGNGGETRRVFVIVHPIMVQGGYVRHLMIFTTTPVFKIG